MKTIHPEVVAEYAKALAISGSNQKAQEAVRLGAFAEMADLDSRLLVALTRTWRKKPATDFLKFVCIRALQCVRHGKDEDGEIGEKYSILNGELRIRQQAA